jgi:hypothetical protein
MEGLLGFLFICLINLHYPSWFTQGGKSAILNGICMLFKEFCNNLGVKKNAPPGARLTMPPAHMKVPGSVSGQPLEARCEACQLLT